MVRQDNIPIVVNKNTSVEALETECPEPLAIRLNFLCAVFTCLGNVNKLFDWISDFPLLLSRHSCPKSRSGRSRSRRGGEGGFVGSSCTTELRFSYTQDKIKILHREKLSCTKPIPNCPWSKTKIVIHGCVLSWHHLVAIPRQHNAHSTMRHHNTKPQPLGCETTRSCNGCAILHVYDQTVDQRL